MTRIVPLWIVAVIVVGQTVGRLEQAAGRIPFIAVGLINLFTVLLLVAVARRLPPVSPSSHSPALASRRGIGKYPPLSAPFRPGSSSPSGEAVMEKEAFGITSVCGDL